MQVLRGKLIKSTFKRIWSHIHICSDLAAIVGLIQRPFLSTVLRYFGPWAVYQVWVQYGHVLGLEHDPSTLVVILPRSYIP